MLEVFRRNSTVTGQGLQKPQLVQRGSPRVDQKGISDSRGKVAEGQPIMFSEGLESPSHFLHMKRILKETIFFLTLSLFISVIYTAASPSGMVLLKKAFRITAPDTPETEKAGNGETLQDDRK